jgi:hypothetical protein
MLKLIAIWFLFNALVVVWMTPPLPRRSKRADRRLS